MANPNEVMTFRPTSETLVLLQEMHVDMTQIDWSKVVESVVWAAFSMSKQRTQVQEAKDGTHPNTDGSGT